MLPFAQSRLIMPTGRAMPQVVAERYAKVEAEALYQTHGLGKHAEICRLQAETAGIARMQAILPRRRTCRGVSGALGTRPKCMLQA
jgi:hypothetical protein